MPIANHGFFLDYYLRIGSGLLRQENTILGAIQVFEEFARDNSSYRLQ